MADYKKYKISAHPAYTTVTPGAKITYICGQTYDTISSPEGPRDKFRWYCYNDRASVKKYGIRSIYDGPAKYVWENAEWKLFGKHTIRCRVDFTDGTVVYYNYPQWVDSVEAVLGAFFRKTNKATVPDPFKEYSVVKRYIEILVDTEKKFPVKGYEKKEKHRKRLEELKTYRDKLGERLDKTWGREAYPVRAAHIEIEKQRKTQLRVYLIRMPAAGGREHWRIIDWTNPSHRLLTGVYDGEGSTKETAIRNAFKEWDEDNEYWPGKLSYEVSKRACGKAIKDSFKTDGKSVWGSVSSFLSYIALGTAVVAGVVMLITPVPGSRLVSAAIWTSIFSSTASAAINIGQRHARGFGNWKDDAFDGLTIVGNVMGAAWMRCATVTLRTGTAARTARYALIGQVGTDGVQGVLIAADHIDRYDKIINDETLTPEERTHRLLELFRSFTIDGVMTYISVKGSKTDLDNVRNGNIDRNLLDDLRDPARTVDLTGTPTVKGNTKKRKLKVKIQDEQIRKNSKKKRGSLSEKYPPDDKKWRENKVTDNKIHLQHPKGGDFSNSVDNDWVFKANKYDDGYVEITIYTRDTKTGKKSDLLRGRECYEVMFEHFEPIKGWRGVFAYDNYKAVKEVLEDLKKAHKGVDESELCKKAVLESITGKKFWKPWAERKGYEMIVEVAEDFPGVFLFRFSVRFEKKK